jgi:hypothetical protein
MKAVIGGKRYDTETATVVASYRNGDYSMTLYVTKNSNWFLVSESGLTGSHLTPLTGKQALSWLEDHRESAAIEEYFAADIEDA